ncbi:hypothetical protein MPTK1_1g09180 [Marchantia polymorpha subsp. ruderalis]|uniref:Uncharacterized protein n=1 Tax=Marchantia polymorpha subsp. ruderalis TaxID=1480154 RepID=A0AAF6AN68_MARPO|nr:hypothetical protein Mp_1g09180 [Marchantia polymorpha subsp. ruderalis]
MNVRSFWKGVDLAAGEFRRILRTVELSLNQAPRSSRKGGDRLTRQSNCWRMKWPVLAVGAHVHHDHRPLVSSLCFIYRGRWVDLSTVFQQVHICTLL